MNASGEALVIGATCGGRRPRLRLLAAGCDTRASDCDGCFPRHEEALREIVDGLSWDFSGFGTSRFIFVAGLTTGARPRLEPAMYEMLSDVNPAAEYEIRASLDALPLNLAD